MTDIYADDVTEGDADALATAFDWIAETRLDRYEYRRKLRALPPSRVLATVEKDLRICRQWPPAAPRFLRNPEREKPAT